MSALNDISKERERQLTKGWDAEHDDGHGDGRLAGVAGLVAIHGSPFEDDIQPDLFDWGIVSKWNGDRRRQLVIAGALIVAEIERIDRGSQDDT